MLDKACSARRFTLLSVGLAVGLTGGLALLNYLVDPHDRYGLNWLGVYVCADREFKATEIRRYPHNALLLGNARMAGVAPRELQGFSFFNGTFAGATAEEVFYFASHFATNINLVVLCVDLGKYDPDKRNGDIFAPASCRTILDNLLDLQTLEYSLRTIADHLAGQPNLNRPDGSYDMVDWTRTADRNNRALRDYTLEFMKRGCEAYSAPAPEQLSFYRRLAACLQQRGIPCVVIIPPLHEAVAQHLRSLPNLAAYQAWRRELGAIFPNVVDLSFSSYGATDNYFKTDPVHFRPEAGARMLNTEVIPVALQLLHTATARQSSSSEARGPSPTPRTERFEDYARPRP